MTENIYKTIFSEEEIRSSEFDEEKNKAYQEDAKWLLDRKGGFIKVGCPACGGAQHNFFVERNGFNYVECLTCSTMFMNPRPDALLVQEFYQQSKGYDVWNKYIFPAAENIRRERLCKPRIDKIISLCKENHVDQDCFVEVGPGFGTFSQEVVKTGFFRKVMVIEPAPSLAATCREKGLTVIEAPIEKAVFSEQIDVVATFEVIEHLFDPKAFVMKCRDILRDGGLLCMSCPNGKGFDFVGAGKEGAPFDHEHLNYFHPRSMRVFFERCGFRVVEIGTPGVLDVELVRSAALKGKISLEGQPFLQQILLDEWDENRGRKFQQFLSDNLLSGHMWTVAQKA